MKMGEKEGEMSAILDHGSVNKEGGYVMTAANYSSNGSSNESSGPPIMLSEEHVGVFGFIFIGLSTVGVFGNGLVIFAILTDRRMRSVMNLLLLNLAVADLGNLLMTIPEWSQILVMRRPIWVIPAMLCPPIRCLTLLFLYTSIYTQVAVAIERFIAIKYPMKARIFCTRRKISLLAFSCWFMGFLFAFPNLLYHINKEVVPGVFVCHFDWILYDQYKLAECLTFYFIPLVVLIVLYSILCRVLWSSNKNLTEGQNWTKVVKQQKTMKEIDTDEVSGKNAAIAKRREKFTLQTLNKKLSSLNLNGKRGGEDQGSSPLNAGTNSSADGPVGATNQTAAAKKQAESLKSRQNVVKMLIGCVAVYFISYSPIQTIYVSDKIFSIKFGSYLSFSTRIGLNAFTVACSACNPVLYTVFSSKFRQKFIRLLLFWRRRKGGDRKADYHTTGTATINNSSVSAGSAAAGCARPRPFGPHTQRQHSTSSFPKTPTDGKNLKERRQFGGKRKTNHRPGGRGIESPLIHRVIKGNHIHLHEQQVKGKSAAAGKKLCTDKKKWPKFGSGKNEAEAESAFSSACQSLLNEESTTAGMTTTNGRSNSTSNGMSGLAHSSTNPTSDWVPPKPMSNRRSVSNASSVIVSKTNERTE